jgi:glutamate synthase domain-containing protein 2
MKALAIGADAVNIGSICTYGYTSKPNDKSTSEISTTTISCLHCGKLQEEFDIEEGAKDLANFLKSCTTEMKGAL